MMTKNLKINSIRLEPYKYLKVSEIINNKKLTQPNLTTISVEIFLLNTNLLNINNLKKSVEIIAKIIVVSRLIPK